MRVYIAGPMTLLPNFNYPAFRAAAEDLRRRGLVVVNPAELTEDSNTPWHVAIRTAIEGMMGCAEVFVLPGWEASRGASIEVELALRVGMVVRRYPSGDRVTGDNVRGFTAFPCVEVR